MGDTHHDPTDHDRTTHQHAGIAVKNNFFWPGFVLLLVAMLGMVSTVVAAAYRQYEWIGTTVLISVLATIAGALWLLVELRHVSGVDQQSVRASDGRRGG
jgi:protein-S-isoprenylcysteine O-methyltransferase Ste14